MRVSIRKTVVAAIAALGMATAIASMPTPAEAQWHGGGGFHGGGFHGGGWHGGGWGGRGVWQFGYWRGGNWYGGWWGPAVAAGVLTGAAIASYRYWGGGYGYGGGDGDCWQVRPTYDAYGNFLGQQSVNVC